MLCYESNPLVRKALEEPGNGRVLVVDAGASLRCAVLGDNLAANAQRNGWAGIIVNGCIRDSETIKGMAGLGVKALATHPLVRACVFFCCLCVDCVGSCECVSVL